MELKQLKYFVAVAELEHFGRASERLHVVQPALSRQVAQLEAEIGVQLFERLSRGVRLTAAGKVLLEQARALLSNADRALAVTRLIAQGKSGYLRIGFADSSTYSGILPAILRQFRISYPQIELDLVPATSIIQGELLVHEEINVGFVYWLPQKRAGINFHELATEAVVLALPKSHPLAKRSSVRLRDLRNVPFVWLKRSDSPIYYDRILSACHKAGLTLNVVQEAFGENTMLSLVAGGIGATFTISSAKKRKPDNVVLIPIEDLKLTLSFKAIWRSDDKTPALAEFLAVVRQSI